MWYYLDRKSSIGPFGDQEVTRLIHTGTVAARTLVWREGLAGWSEAENSELAAHFGKVFTPSKPTTVLPSVIGLKPPSPHCLASSAPPQEFPMGFEDPTSLAKWISALMILQIGLAGVLICARGVEIVMVLRMLDQAEHARTVLAQSDQHWMILARIEEGAHFLTVFFFARWTYIVARNVRRMGARGFEFTPGWAVGYYFIPVFNLWKPYFAMNEIWKASHAPLDWQNQPDPPILGRWWAFWVISLVVHTNVRLGPHARSLIELTAPSLGWIFGAAIEMTLCFCAMLVVRQLSEAQINTARRLV